MARIYVITEGAEGKSQFAFWKEVNRVVYHNSLILIGCYGIKNARNTFNALLNSLSDLEISESLFIFDLDTVIGNMTIQNSIEELRICTANMDNVYF